MTQIGNYFTLNFYNNMLKHYTSPFLLSPVWVTKHSKWHSHFPFQTAVIVVPFLRTSYLEWIGVKLCGNFAADHVLRLAAIEWTMSISVEQEKTSMATKRYYLVEKVHRSVCQGAGANGDIKFAVGDQAVFQNHLHHRLCNLLTNSPLLGRSFICGVVALSEEGR